MRQPCSRLLVPAHLGSEVRRGAPAVRRFGPPVFALLVCAIALSGCQSFWASVRENERTFALEKARNQAKRGQCADAVDALDRAEAAMAIGRFAIEATQIRVRCYEKLGLDELESAHRRMLDDYYREDPMAFPAEDGSSVFRARTDLPTRFERPPGWLEIARPRYTPHAQRSKIIGRVVVAFGLGEKGKTERIRVLEMAHPLLATWAIEAVARAGPRRGRREKIPVIESDLTYVTTFNFEWRWADEPAPEPVAP